MKICRKFLDENFEKYIPTEIKVRFWNKKILNENVPKEDLELDIYKQRGRFEVLAFWRKYIYIPRRNIQDGSSRNELPIIVEAFPS